jgi:transposase-like protein
MAKKKRSRSRRYPPGFRNDAVERMKSGVEIQALADELDVSRGALYLWRRKADGLPSYRDAARGGVIVPDEKSQKILQLEAKVAGLEGELGRRSVEASFFRSALRKVEALRRQNEGLGETPSTTKSAAGRNRKAK